MAIKEAVRLIWFEGSSCDCLLLQATSLFDSFAFNALPLFDNGRCSAEVDMGQCPGSRRTSTLDDTAGGSTDIPDRLFRAVRHAVARLSDRCSSLG